MDFARWRNVGLPNNAYNRIPKTSILTDKAGLSLSNTKYQKFECLRLEAATGSVS